MTVPFQCGGAYGSATYASLGGRLRPATLGRSAERFQPSDLIEIGKYDIRRDAPPLPVIDPLREAGSCIQAEHAREFRVSPGRRDD